MPLLIYLFIGVLRSFSGLASRAVVFDFSSTTIK